MDDGCIKCVSRVFKGHFQDVFKMFQMLLKEVSSTLQGSFRGVSTTFQRHYVSIVFKGLSSKIQRKEFKANVKLDSEGF